jgi:hypothetical protein
LRQVGKKMKKISFDENFEKKHFDRDFNYEDFQEFRKTWFAFILLGRLEKVERQYILL